MDVLLSPAGLRRLADVVFAGTALHLAWLVATQAPSSPPPIRMSVVALNVVMAALFVVRHGEGAPARVAGWVAALPSLMLGAVLAAWPGLRYDGVTVALFCAGALGALLSMLALGRSFAVLPGARVLVVRGPYRLVRHPMYLCELVMFAALVSAAPAWGSATRAAVIGVALAALVWRIHAEERALAVLHGHAGYARRVRYRLLPCLW